MVLIKTRDRLAEVRFDAPEPTQQASRVEARVTIPNIKVERHGLQPAGPSHVGLSVEIQFGFDEGGTNSLFALFTSLDLSSSQTFFGGVNLGVDPSFAGIEEGTSSESQLAFFTLHHFTHL
ncbi:hypothetical protein VNO77_43203 [Canavalia gladiata]|uniref:Uncharacterized protein n=1 Tax=Canavalia gladiata TaxID=3824 RepID=A0AAN9PP86_CANGL